MSHRPNSFLELMRLFIVDGSTLINVRGGSSAHISTTRHFYGRTEGVSKRQLLFLSEVETFANRR